MKRSDCPKITARLNPDIHRILKAFLKKTGRKLDSTVELALIAWIKGRSD